MIVPKVVLTLGRTCNAICQILTKRKYSVVHYLSNKQPRTSVCQIDLELQLVLYKQLRELSGKQKVHEAGKIKIGRMFNIRKHGKCNASRILLPSAFTKILGKGLPGTRLDGCDSLHSCRELSILARDTRRQPGEIRDPLTRASRLLKKRDLNEARQEHQGCTRGSKARRVFPSTFSLSPCLGFPRRECTACFRSSSALCIFQRTSFHKSTSPKPKF